MEMKTRIVQGDDVDLVFIVKDKAGSIVDLTGATAITFKAKNSIYGDTYISKSMSDAISINSPATDGEITVSLADSDTSADNLPAGDYVFELQITDSAGDIMTVRDFNDNLGKIEVMADLDQ